jgi:surface protein
MKKSILFVLVALFANGVHAQDFITVWGLNNPGSTTNSIAFGVGTTGTVNYTWETIPAGTTGSGSFYGNTATISGLPAYAVIRLKINPTNFNRININYGLDRNRLLDVEQWGGVPWTSMENAFRGCNSLNVSAADVPDLSLVTNMSYMFDFAFVFNQSIGNWNTSNVTNMECMFRNAVNFNQPIGNWNTINVTNMRSMFQNATSFNQSIGNWNTINVTNMRSMFWLATSFNQPIGNWNTSNVTDMLNLFRDAVNFNQPIGNWNTSNVSNMEMMFGGDTSFNQPIGNWNTSNVTYMNYMFYNATSFNQPIGNWNTSNVINMSYMFYKAYGFNQPIGNWNTSNVLDMRFLFRSATSFNQPIGNWNTSNVSQIEGMFISATSFNQPIGNWTLTANTNYMLDSCGMDCTNYSTTLNGWANNINTANGKTLGAFGIKYGTNAVSGRNYLLNTKGWSFVGDVANGFTCCVATSSNFSQTTCNSYLFNNQTLTQSGIYYDTLINSTGCDSIITLNLTINSSSNTINQSACNSYTFNNQTLTTSGIYFDTLLNSTGCDSIITLNLTINNANITTTQTGTQLSATASGASYQWLTCNPFTIISGDTNQTYTSTTNGDYAVVVTQNGCTDTSNCMTVNSVGINEQNTQSLITISPNPTNSIFKIECPMNGANVILYNSFGQKLSTTKIENQTSLIDISHFSKGIYMAEIIDDKTTYRVKIIKD